MEASQYREEQEAPVGGSSELVGSDLTTAASPWKLFWRRFKEDKLALASLIFVGVLALIAIFAPQVVDLVGAPDPDERDQSALDAFATPTGPSADHIFGVDRLGQDIFSLVIYGARISLVVAFAATAAATVVGVILGLIAGYYRGWTDTLISRGVDVLLAIPYLLLATGLAAACATSVAGEESGCLGGLLKPGVGVVIFVIAFTTWPLMARIVRGQVLSIREKEFVEAARSAGASNLQIVFREILPNLAAPIIVYASILIPQVILYEAALSYLGIGVTGQPSWGQLISDATPDFNVTWWAMFFPGMALLMTVLAFNLIGDSMQDALNPRTRSRS